MIKDLSNKMTEYINYLQDTITDEEELNNVINKTKEFIDAVIIEMEKLITYKEKEIKNLFKRQDETDEKMKHLENVMTTMYKDIYEDEDDFEIICPYCNNQVDIDIDETIKEIICPECKNIIELDWETDDDNNDINKPKI